MRFKSVNGWETISLHDCNISQLILDKYMEVFIFQNGFWVTPKNEVN